MMNPRGAGDIIKAAEIFGSGSTKGSPALGMWGILLWLREWLVDKVGASLLCVAIPGVHKVAERRPGPRSRTNLSISPCYCLIAVAFVKHADHPFAVLIDYSGVQWDSQIIVFICINRAHIMPSGRATTASTPAGKHHALSNA